MSGAKRSAGRSAKKWHDHSRAWRSQKAAQGWTARRYDKWLTLAPSTRKRTDQGAYASGKSAKDSLKKAVKAPVRKPRREVADDLAELVDAYTVRDFDKAKYKRDLTRYLGELSDEDESSIREIESWEDYLNVLPNIDRVDGYNPLWYHNL